ncbi:MAG: cytochrome c-type biogenesis protein CcmH, partial [Dehalococcoidia bacterium]|nr:cytochrome c-type biogenesis protein CcmH [Dehalococcoidia bacterium]
QAQSANTEVRRIADKLQCPVCQGTSVADSPSAVADSMRSEIRARLEQGQSERQIVDFFVTVYGLGVLREPPKTGWYSAVWWGPGVALLLGAAIIFVAVRGRRQAESPREPAPAIPAAAPEDERYRAEVRREIEERER